MFKKRNIEKITNDPHFLSSEEVLSLPSDEILRRMETSLTGLSSDEAEKRLETYGSNEISTKKRTSIFLEFLSHFKSPLVIILVVAAIVSGFLGELVDALIIVAIVLMSVILDFTQEHRAERAAEKLKRRVATTATIFRDGIKQDIEVLALVPEILSSFLPAILFLQMPG